LSIIVGAGNYGIPIQLERIVMPAQKGNRSKKKLKNRAKTKKQALKRRRVRARKSKGKY
jgi:hypothetical protein